MRIAVCDDDALQREELCALLEQWAEKTGRLGQTLWEPFPSAEALLFRREEAVFDAALLDVEMPGQDGLALARKLRESDEDMALIFITGYDEYMPEGYEVAALNYLIKPVRADKLFACLDRAQEKWERQKQSPMLLVEREGELVRLPQKELVWAEAFGHQVVLHTRQGDYPIRETLTELELKLERGEFFRCHRSCLISLRYAVRVSREGVQLETGGACVPVSRRSYPALNQAFLEYYKKAGEMT